MSPPLLPLLAEPEDVARLLKHPRLRIVDVGRREIYVRTHLPGALHIDYDRLVMARPPATGLLPDAGALTDILGGLGLQADDHVVAYDDEANGRAARLLWTLDAAGHSHFSLLNGGLEQWQAEDRPVESGERKLESSPYRVALREQVTADLDYVRSHLRDPEIVLLDTRSPDEYSGKLKRAARGGHIPGAVNYNWTDAMDHDRYLRIRPAEDIQRELAALGVALSKEIVVYCQTHHRSAHTYIVLKHLGYPRVRGYAGSWSEWGNHPDTPIE